MQEEWLPVSGYEELYEVSNFGAVRRLGRSQPLSPDITKGGHHRVGLSSAGKTKKHYVHTLMLIAFVGDRRSEGLMVRHLDGDPQNNSLENLKWGTASENQMDKVFHGRNKDANKLECVRGHKFTEGNVTPSSLKEGKRRCLACIRARAYLNYQQPDFTETDLQTVSDYYFAKNTSKEGDLIVSKNLLDGGLPALQGSQEMAYE